MSEQKIPELLPCPFCGGPVRLEMTHRRFDGVQFWGITCRNTFGIGGSCAEEINDAWADVCAANVANRDLPAPDVVPVPREEWAVWQKVKSAVCRLDKGISADEWDTVLIGVVRSIHALRSGEAGKEREA